MRPSFRVLAALLALAGGAFAQTPSVPSPAAPAAPSLPRATAPTLPARIGTPVSPAPSGATTAALTTPKKIDVNSADESEIASLPGIGPATAKAIVAGRPWDKLGDLAGKKAINRPTFERNKDRLALANINTSTAEMMAKTLPGVGEKTAPKIVDARPYATPDELVSKKVLTAAQFAKIKDVIAY